MIASHASEAWNVEHGWRIIFATGIAPAIVFLLLLIWVPESPRWLIRKGRDAQGLTILRKINPDETTAREQLAAIKSALLSDSPSRLRELFTPRLRKALVVGFCVALFQQITGINAIFITPRKYLKPRELMSAARCRLPYLSDWYWLFQRWFQCG